MNSLGIEKTSVERNQSNKVPWQLNFIRTALVSKNQVLQAEFTDQVLVNKFLSLKTLRILDLLFSNSVNIFEKLESGRISSSTTSFLINK